MIIEGVAVRPMCSKYVRRHWATHQFAQWCAIFPAEAQTVAVEATHRDYYFNVLDPRAARELFFHCH